MAQLLTLMAMLDLLAGRTQDATAHVREALQIAVRADMPPYKTGCRRRADLTGLALSTGLI